MANHRRPNRRRSRFTKRQLHNIRAICLWIIMAVIVILLITGLVKTIKKVHNRRAAKKTESVQKEKKSDNDDSSTVEEERTLEALVDAALEDIVDCGERENSTQTLTMVGDIVLHDSFTNRLKNSDGSYAYEKFFSELKDDIKSNDTAIINAEVIIGGSKIGISGYPEFNAAFDLADDIADAGFNVVLHASNHAGDKGSKGIKSCLNYWNTTYPGITVAGIHSDEKDADKLSIVENNGIKIAILNYTEKLNDNLDSDNSYMIERMDEDDMDAVRDDIKRAKEEADFVLVCPHWGTEDSSKVTESQKKWARLFIDEEVDLVIGTHPHVVQPVKMYENKKTKHQTLIYYSIGNLCSWVSNGNSTSIKHLIGGMPKVTIGLDDNMLMSIKDYSIQPIVCHFTGDDGEVAVYPVEKYSEELASKHSIKQYSTKFSYETIKNYCIKIWGDLWQQV